MAKFRELAIDGPKIRRQYGNPGLPFYMSPKIMKYINPIHRAQYYAVGGRMSGGKSSFTDQFFIMGVFLWLMYLPKEQRPPVKILYFNLDKTEQQKFQKLLCTYLWLYHGQFMDINTLNGTSSKTFDLTPGMESMIEGSESFFEGLSEVLDMRTGTYTPDMIYNETVRYLKTLGEDDEDKGEFTYDPLYENQITLVVVNNVRKLNISNKAGTLHTDSDIHNRMNNHFVTLRDRYKATPVAVVPSWDIPGVIRLNQMVPDFREFKYYYDDVNVAFHLFNPFKFGIKNYNGFPAADFVSIGDGIPRFRVCSILKNTDGADTAQLTMFFIPENGVFSDLPAMSDKESMDKSIEYAQTFKHQIIQAATSA